MKLVEILARELKEWPDKAVAITQDACGEVWPLSKLDDSVEFMGSRWLSNHCFMIVGDIIPGAQVASDHATAIVTRAKWQEAKDRLEGKTVKKPNANKDGWVRHRGGKCPVEAGTLVDIRLRNGDIKIGVEAITGWADDWSHTNSGYDTMAYRIHTPSEQPATVEESSPAEPVINGTTCISEFEKPAPAEFKVIYDPLQWRDRITEIDAESKAETERHSAAMSALDAERAELVQKLASEGLALIERNALEEWKVIAKEEGKLVHAVKAHREMYGSTLKRAVDEVKSYRASIGIY